MIAWGIESLIATAALLLAVLVIRRPVRRAFGPELAYALWAIPALRMMLPPLPEAWRLSALPPLPAAEAVTIYLGQPVATLPPIATAGGIGWLEAGLALWLVGAAVFLTWHIARYFRFRHRVLRNGMAVDRIGSITVVESVAASGPLAFGVIDRVVVLPRDFAMRYDANERALALAHELGHHARGDLIANWVALAILALHWCNPLAWYAFRAFRADQEMANDARVLAGRSLAERHAYACAVVKSAHGGAISLACHLHSVNDLKGRLKMLASHRRSRRHAGLGTAAVAMLALAGLGLTASGTHAAQAVREEVVQATGVDLAALEPVEPLPLALPAASAKRDRRVTIVTNGRTTTYSGDAADAYIAANPVPMPPVPPVPPMPALPALAPMPPVPPMPPLPPEAAWPSAGQASVRSADCPPDDGPPSVIRAERGGRRVTIVCNDRIERLAKRAAERAARASERAVEAAKMARHAQASAVQGLRRVRASLATARTLPAGARADSLMAIDESIAGLEDDLRATR